MSKRIIWVMILVIFAGVQTSGAAVRARSLAAGVAAVVNNDIITTTELSRAIELAEKRITDSGQPLPQQKELDSAVLHHLIDIRLQLQLAKRFNMTKSEADVDAAIQHIKHSQHLSDKLFAEKLAQEGRSERALRAEIREQLILNAVQQRALGDKLRITAPQVAAFKKDFIHKSTQYLIQDVLVQLPEEATTSDKSTALIRAKQIQHLMQKGQALPQQAKDISYIDQGWRNLDDLPSIFVKPLAKLNINAVSAPILAANGYHVVQLIDKRHTDLTDVQAQQLLMQQHYSQAYPEWITKLRQGAYIKVNSKTTSS